MAHQEERSVPLSATQPAYRLVCLWTQHLIFETAAHKDIRTVTLHRITTLLVDEVWIEILSLTRDDIPIVESGRFVLFPLS